MIFNFQIFILAKRKFSKPIAELYDIHYSKFFKNLITFNPEIRELRHAVHTAIDFGDLVFNPVLNKKCQRARRKK